MMGFAALNPSYGLTMRIFSIILVGLVVAFAALLIWRSLETPTYVHRFRLVIEVLVDGEVRNGSSVIEVRNTDYKIGLPESKGIRSRVLGQAVFVDLGNGRHVIGILGFGPTGSDDWIPGLTESAFAPSHPGLSYQDVPKLIGTAPLTKRYIPTLVTFSNLNDPTTARVVAPSAFEQVFGAEVQFKRAFVEMIPVGFWPFNALGWPHQLGGEPVTRGIDKKLPWLPHPSYLSGRYGCGPTEPHCLHGGHFTRS